MKKSFAVAFLGVLVSCTLPAQEVERFTFGVGAGFTNPVGRTGTNLDVGWNVRAGAGINFSQYVGAMVDVGYDSMGVNSGVLSNLGYGGGRMSVLSATLNPVIHLVPKSKVDVYITGGGGLYHEYRDFTQPTVVTGTGFDPFFGFFPVAVPGQVVVSSYSVNKPGIDAGFGVAFGSKWHGKFFAEARYNRIFAGTYHTDFVPVTFGFRW